MVTETLLCFLGILSGKTEEMDAAGPMMTVPAIVVSQNRTGSDPFIKPSDLPSAKFRYDVWHELKDNTIDADELNNPRVRKGPHSSDRHGDSSSSSSSSSDSEDEERGRVRKKKKDRRWLRIRRNYRDEHENWKEAKVVNLSYQNLGDDYQVSNFMGVIGLLKSCEELHIMSNELRDLSKISLPCCKFLNMTSNHLRSFKQLPKAELMEHLNLSENNIPTLDGIERLKNLKTLYLIRNPVSYSFDYRAHVFAKLPGLRVLDGTPKLESDDNFEYPHEKNSCIIA